MNHVSLSMAFVMRLSHWSRACLHSKIETSHATTLLSSHLQVCLGCISPSHFNEALISLSSFASCWAQNRISLHLSRTHLKPSSQIHSSLPTRSCHPHPLWSYHVTICPFNFKGFFFYYSWAYSKSIEMGENDGDGWQLNIPWRLRWMTIMEMDKGRHW